MTLPEDARPVAPTRTDAVARDLSERVGGPVGQHARPHSFWVPVRVVLAVATVVCSLALVQKVPCLQTHWTNNDVRYAKMCYSDVPYLYVDRGLAEHQWPYAESRYQPLEYPVLISYFAWAASWLTEPFATGPPEAVRAAHAPSEFWGLPGMTTEINRYFLVSSVLLLAAGLLAAYWLAGANPRRPWDAMAFAASPALLFTGLVNWDLLAVACVAGAMWAWARGRPALTGVMLGLGTATKLYPLFLFGALLVVCLRRRQLPALARVAAAGVITWVAVDLPAVLTGFAQWRYFWTFNAQRGPDLGSLWLLFSDPTHPISAHTVNQWSWVLFGIACLGVLLLGLRAPATPRVAQLGLLIVVAFLLVNKVYSPQYVLWLLPLAVLARPRWRDLLIWQVCELYYFGAVWLYLGGFTSSGTAGGADVAYHLATVVRVVGELYLCATVLRDIWHPERDPVREPARNSGQSTTTASNRVVV